MMYGYGYGARPPAKTAALPAGGGVVPIPAPDAVYLPITPSVIIAARKVISTYSGPLLQVRKGGDAGTTFDVPVLANGLNDDAAAIAWAAGSEMRVSIAYNQGSTGSAGNFVPAAWALMPLYDPAELYGKAGKHGAFTSFMFDGWFNTPSTRVSKAAPIVVPGSLNRNNISVFDVLDPKSALYNQSFWAFTPSSFLGMGTAAANDGLYVGEFTNKSSGKRLRQKFQTIGVTNTAGNGMKIIQDGLLVSAAAASSLVLTGGWLGVGSSGPTGTTDFIDTSNRLAFAVYPAGLSDVNAAAVWNALNATFGLTTNTQTQIIIGGDSNAYGAQSVASQQNRTITREVRNLYSAGAEFYNMALSSQQLMGAGGQIAMASTREDLLLVDGAYTKRVFVSTIGGNDLATFGGTAGFAQTLYNAHVAELVRLKSIGATRTVIATIPTRGVFAGSDRTAIEWANYNALVRANAGGVDAVADIAAWFTPGTERVNFANPTYWQESTHWTGFVNHELAPIIAAVL